MRPARNVRDHDEKPPTLSAEASAGRAHDRPVRREEMHRDVVIAQLEIVATEHDDEEDSVDGNVPEGAPPKRRRRSRAGSTTSRASRARKPKVS